MRASSRSSQFFANFQSLITVSGGDLQHFRSFFHAQPPEEPQLDDLRLSFVLRRQRLKRIVDGDQVLGTVTRDREVLVERDPL